MFQHLQLNCQLLYGVGEEWSGLVSTLTQARDGDMFVCKHIYSVIGGHFAHFHHPEQGQIYVWS